MKIASGIVGLLCASLGGLWLLQGLGWVRVRPILCFADCAEVQGASGFWAIAGLLVTLAGVTFGYFALRRRAKP